MFGKKKKDLLDFGGDLGISQMSPMSVLKSKETLMKNIDLFKKSKSHLAKALEEVGQLTKFLFDEKHKLSSKLADPATTGGGSAEAYANFTLIDSFLVNLEMIQKDITTEINASDSTLNIFEKGYEILAKETGKDETNLS